MPGFYVIDTRRSCHLTSKSLVVVDETVIQNFRPKRRRKDCHHSPAGRGWTAGLRSDKKINFQKSDGHVSYHRAQIAHPVMSRWEYQDRAQAGTDIILVIAARL